MRIFTKSLFYRSNDRGYSLIEISIVVAIVFIIAGMAVPRFLALVSNLRSGGDIRDLNGEIVLAKMRAASNFARARVYVDLSANTFHIETYQSGATSWTPEGGTQYLSKNVTFGYGSLTTPPSNTQTTIGQAPACLKDDLTATTVTYANTACIMFNSRGIPVDATWAPTGQGAFYVTDGTSTGAVTVSATGLTHVWRSDASAAHWINH